MAPRIYESRNSDSHKAKKMSTRSQIGVTSCRRRLFSGPLDSSPVASSCRRRMPSMHVKSSPSKKERSIFLAIERGDLQKVKELVQHTGPAVRKPQSRYSLLHLAALNNQKQMVEFLLEFISPNVVCAFNRTPAHVAALGGHLDVLKILISDKEANPNIRDVYNQTYKDLLVLHLFVAILSEDERKTKQLLSLGADPDSYPGNDVEGILSRELFISTPRQLALSLNQESILTLLPKKQDSHPLTVEGQIPLSLTQLGPLRVKVKSAMKCVTGDDVYTMNSNSRGFVCILNFGSFKGRPDLELEASTDDTKNLANVFNQMGYSGEIHQSLTSTETMETLARIRDTEKLNDASCAIFIISSHATNKNETFLASDMEQLPTEQVLNFFADAECPQLANKPKVFIFDFCRGYYTEKCTGVPISSRKRVKELQKDIVCIYSSNTGFTPYNYSKDGSVFPTALCHTLAKHAHDLELNEIFRELVLECGKTTSLVPLMKNVGFTKKFFLNPAVSRSLLENGY